jgi:hypothetical protein
MNNGVSVAFTSYALAAVISIVTAGLMALILKAVRFSSKKG